MNLIWFQYISSKFKNQNSHTIGHFTVMDGSEADGDLVLVQTFLLYYVN